MDSLRFVHVSDLHVGDQQYGNPSHWLHSGLNGHDPDLVRELSVIWRGLPQDHLVVSGDLTRVGDIGDYGVVREYLTGQWPANPPSNLRPGLQLARDKFSAVPGNHDHWAGAHNAFFAPLYNPAGFIHKFGATVWGPVSLTSGDLLLELYGVDSSAGWQGSSFGIGPRQGGSITDLTSLEDLVQKSSNPASGVKRLRALVCHHSFDNVTGAPLPLDGPSRTRLLNFAAAYDFQVVLTGHTHYLDVCKRTPPSDPSKLVWELRAPATLIGPARQTGSGARPFHPTSGKVIDASGFLVHEVTLAGSPQRPHWYVHAYLWNGGTFAAYPRFLVFS